MGTPVVEKVEARVVYCPKHKVRLHAVKGESLACGKCFEDLLKTRA